MASRPQFDLDNLPDAAFERMGISREKFAGIRAEMAKRDAKTPPAGSVAPDFEIERLSPDGKRTGETFQLSSARGRPVALVFGSYT